jgi:hypothetical protein
MKTTTPHPQGELLKNVFGPDGWCRRASRVLGLSVGHVYELAKGQAPFRRRHLLVIETFCNNRRRAASTETALAVQKAKERVQSGLQSVAIGETAAKALLSDLERNRPSTARRRHLPQSATPPS